METPQKKDMKVASKKGGQSSQFKYTPPKKNAKGLRNKKNTSDKQKKGKVLLGRAMSRINKRTASKY